MGFPVYEAGVIHADPRLHESCAECAPLVASGLEKRVVHAFYPRTLDKDCPNVPALGRVGTWSQLSELAAQKLAEGLLRPRLLQRAAGSFTAPHAEEVLYVVDPGRCVADDLSFVDAAVFDASSEGEGGRMVPKVRARWSGFGDVPRLVGLLSRAGRDLLILHQGHELMATPFTDDLRRSGEITRVRDCPRAVAYPVPPFDASAPLLACAR